MMAHYGLVVDNPYTLNPCITSISYEILHMHTRDRCNEGIGCRSVHWLTLVSDTDSIRVLYLHKKFFKQYFLRKQPYKQSLKNCRLVTRLAIEAFHIYKILIKLYGPWPDPLIVYSYEMQEDPGSMWRLRSRRLISSAACMHRSWMVLHCLHYQIWLHPSDNL